MNLIDRAERVNIGAISHHPGCYEERNRWIVNNSGAMSILLEPGRERSGTGRCALYADKRGRVITPLWERWVRFQETRRT